jgi:hypothetical protein
MRASAISKNFPGVIPPDPRFQGWPRLTRRGGARLTRGRGQVGRAEGREQGKGAGGRGKGRGEREGKKGEGGEKGKKLPAPPLLKSWIRPWVIGRTNKNYNNCMVIKRKRKLQN